MSKFKIKPGNYVVPKIGKVSTFKGISDDTALKLYESSSFPFIEPIVSKPLKDYLKSQNLDDKRITTLINAAQSVKEVELLASLTSNKTVKNIAMTKIAAKEDQEDTRQEQSGTSKSAEVRAKE